MCPIQLGTDLGGRYFYGSREFRAVGGGGGGKPGGPLGAGREHSVEVGAEALLLGCQDMAQAGQAGFAHVAEIYMGWVWFHSWIQSFCLLPSFAGKIVSCFFPPIPPPPWPSVSQRLLLASSMTDSGQIGTSPFPLWEGTWLSFRLPGCFGHPFLHLLQHLHSFP